jgi:hypothetical protein
MYEQSLYVNVPVYSSIFHVTMDGIKVEKKKNTSKTGGGHSKM